MSTPASPQQRRPSRKITKTRREPGKIAMDIPERFKVDEEEEDAAEADESHREMPFMHKSIFGVIAAAQSKDDFQSMMQEEEGEDEREKVVGETMISAPERGRAKTTESMSRPPKFEGAPAEIRIQKSIPGLRSNKSSRNPNASTSYVSTSTSNRSPSLASMDAPVMSQMLQARAQAEDVESSAATLQPAKGTSEKAAAAVKASTSLPEALKNIFRFDEPEEVIAEYPCWFLQSVLLQGYMYITQRHICFYAYLQQKTNTVLKSGYLSKRGKTNPHYRRYWFSLKGNVLTYFTDPSTPYFPSGNIDLRYGISAQLVPSKDKSKDPTYFTVTTDKRVYHFKADSPTSAKEWVKQLQKVIFRSHNDGDSVKISLPIDNVLDVEENPVIDFAETIKVRVIDNDQTYAVDEYFFAFFSSGKDALDVLQLMTQDTSASKASKKDAVSPANRSPDLDLSPVRENAPRLSMGLDVPSIHESVRATTTTAPASSSDSPRPSMDLSRSSLDIGGRSLSRPRISFDKSDRSASAASRVSFTQGRPAARSPVVTSRSTSPAAYATSSSVEHTVPSLRQDTTKEDVSASQILAGSAVFHEHQAKSLTPISSQKAGKERIRRSASPALHKPSAEIETLHQKRPGAHGKPLGSSRNVDTLGRKGSYTESLGGLMKAGAYPMKRATDIAGLLKDQGKRVSTFFGTSSKGYYEKVNGAWEGGKRHYSDADALQSEDHVVDADEEADTAQAEMRFRQYFALPDSERLVASYFAHILRVLPLYGKIYFGSTKLCFRSLLPGTRTKLVIPIKDILNVDKEKGFRFGYSGMVVVIRGHEEIFFEFASHGLRDDCTVTILRALDALQRSNDLGEESVGEGREPDDAADEDLLLQRARLGKDVVHDTSVPLAVEKLESGLPAILFDDTDASVLDIRPKTPLRITCLTIGSRGDVQPYIALCKGLLRDGHKPKIATHEEFGPWVRKHGIDFAPVEGDPAELMRICVDNGMFTPSFLYEANSKFRGFLETLLTTSWTACRDSDLLIESPSAMAGIHIAEALGIPYFRAFTMPWTRTRAYPHAFAVPNHKMGGAYNYMTYVFFDNIFWQSTAGQVNRWRRKVLGLRPTTLDKLQPNKVPFLYNFSPSVVVPPLDFSDWVRVTGYWFLDEATDWVPSQDLLDFIKKAREDKMPLVYIGFGSVVVSDPEQLTRDVVAAVLKADVRCILSKGWSDRLDKKDASIPEVALPDSIYKITSAPHDWLFKQIDVAVHHGGAGTTGASLRAGVPTIIKPFFGDQFFFANRVHDLGVGLHIKRITENALGKALWIASHDQRMRDKARLLGEQIRQEHGVDTAIKAIYRDMDYARTLIKKREVVTLTGKEDDEDEEGEAGGDVGLDNTEESWTFVENDDSDEEVPEAMTRSTWGSFQPAREEKDASEALGNSALKGR